MIKRRKSLGEMTSQELAVATPQLQNVVGRLQQAIREIRRQMPNCADHLLRRIFVDVQADAMCYDQGEEPRIHLTELLDYRYR